DLTGEQPAHGLEPGVRVGRHVHPTCGADVVRAVVIGEAPGADEGALSLGQGPADGHGPRASERYVAGLEDLDAVAMGRFGWAERLLGRGLDIAHAASLAPPGAT